jgi:hypothetical protein
LNCTVSDRPWRRFPRSMSARRTARCWKAGCARTPANSGWSCGQDRTGGPRHLPTALGDSPTVAAIARLVCPAAACYGEQGLAGLADRQWPGRPPIYDHDDWLALVKQVRETPPDPASHWTMPALQQALADDVGMSASRIRTIVERSAPCRSAAWFWDSSPVISCSQISYFCCGVNMRALSTLLCGLADPHRCRVIIVLICIFRSAATSW